MRQIIRDLTALSAQTVENLAPEADDHTKGAIAVTFWIGAATTLKLIDHKERHFVWAHLQKIGKLQDQNKLGVLYRDPDHA